LGWSLLTRSRPKGAEWSVNRWRRNGFQVIVMGLGLLELALWVLVATLRVTG
jgi:hypothetical protein